ncbi:hypothetical protein D9M68_815130 [compost metagenome]
MGFQWYGSGAGKGRTGFYRAGLNNLTSHDIGYGHAPGRMGVQHMGLLTGICGTSARPGTSSTSAASPCR